MFLVCNCENFQNSIFHTFAAACAPGGHSAGHAVWHNCFRAYDRENFDKRSCRIDHEAAGGGSANQLASESHSKQRGLHRESRPVSAHAEALSSHSYEGYEAGLQSH